MPKSNNIASFVLRFTQELSQKGPDEPEIRWRGHIRHVQGGDEGRFTDFTEAVTFMQHHLTELTADTLAGDKNMSQDKIIKESFKMWEQFAANYANMMFKAVEQTTKQSELLKETVDEAKAQALKVWGLPNYTSQTQILELLQSLHSQIQTLTDRIEALEKVQRQARD
jgi:hypothetical protein